MTAAALPDFLPALPEIFLAVSAMALLILGSFQHAAHATREISWLSVVVLAIAVALVAAFGFERHVSLYGLFVTDGFAVFMKILVLIGSLLSVILSMRFNEKEHIARFEYPVLVLLATTGQRPHLALSRPRAAEPRALRDCQLSARQPALDRGRPQVFCPGRALLGHAALRRLDGLWLCRHHQFRRAGA
jgi:hypothetical protein